jgi:hypothetical protein
MLVLDLSLAGNATKTDRSIVSSPSPFQLLSNRTQLCRPTVPLQGREIAASALHGGGAADNAST